VIMRWVAAPTRKLHPASDCFQGIGYQIEPMPMHADANGKLWSSFVARRGAEQLLVRERIFSGSELSWPDVSSRYWAGVTGSADGPWCRDSC
jgi:hypothetical protein